MEGLLFKNWKDHTRIALSYLVMIACAIAFVLPFLWMLSSSLKPLHKILVRPIQWIPKPPVWENYPTLMKRFPFGLYYRNTTTITLLSLVGELIACTLAGYGFARLKFFGRDAIFLLVLGTMMLPYQVTIIPLFILFRNFGWLNTHLPLIVPSYFGSPFYIFIMRQFFLNIPSELEDAAAIDGCSNIRTFWNVFLPLAKPAVVSVGLFTFMAKWNDFFNPLIYLNAPRKFTLTLGLASLNNEHGSEWNLLMAGSVMAMLPCLLLFFFFQRYFVEGLASSGIKG